MSNISWDDIKLKQTRVATDARKDDSSDENNSLVVGYG